MAIFFVRKVESFRRYIQANTGWLVYRNIIFKLDFLKIKSILKVHFVNAMVYKTYVSEENDIV